MESVVHKCLFRRVSQQRKRLQILSIVFLVVCSQCVLAVLTALASEVCQGPDCQEGQVCDRGWQGKDCRHCGGRVKLTDHVGIITDGPGNYSVNKQCTWLIDSGHANGTIRLHFHQFETECSWDHLYVFDGDSVFSPLVAAYSGLLVRDSSKDHVPEIVTHSGSAYLYFYSDAVYNMSGFNISYSVNGCPGDCSNNGVCIEGVCTCSAGWTGKSCDTPICPGNCGNGSCEKEDHRCSCRPGFKGIDCTVLEDDSIWDEEETEGQVEARALHVAIIVGDAMWVFGGETLKNNVFQHVAKYVFPAKAWVGVKSASDVGPAARHSHTVVLYKDQLYMYGGMLYNRSVVNDLWKFSPVTGNWTEISAHVDEPECESDLCSPIAATGHTAHMVDDIMVVIFGHNPVYGYLNTVQEYNFVTGKWDIVRTTGAIVKGGYGHSSVQDTATRVIYVYGGYHSYGTAGLVVDLLYSYTPHNRSWMYLSPSPSYRYLHSSVILQGMMLVFGGNTHNDSTHSTGDKCFSSDLLAYDIACDTWHKILLPPLPRKLARFGHSSVVFNGSMYVFGGFNGQILGDIIKFSPGLCRRHKDEDACEKAALGIKCLWNSTTNSCESFVVTDLHTLRLKCPRGTGNFSALCEKFTSCPSCLQNTYGCVWCGTFCTYKSCPKNLKETKNMISCDEAESSNCDKLHNCHACHTEYHCGWQADDKCYTFVRELGNKTEKAVLSDDYRVKCEAPCKSYATCETCIDESCMWCNSQKTCVEINAYAAAFPTAQCREWTAQPRSCSGLTCQEIQSCDACQERPECGWCDDGSETGRGTCTEGSASGPVVRNGSSYVPDVTACLPERWYFTSCPDCQCNGHSTCSKETGVCEYPCKHLTEGSHCQYCMMGYYGNPVNGGNCTLCFCHNHGDLCNKMNGKCHCTTKGIIGHHCERCDETNHYVGSPQKDGGTCFYDLSIDYQYTFNMSKSEDRYYTFINFMNTPVKPDVDVDFSISCSSAALVNMTVASASLSELILHQSRECGSFKIRFSHEDHLFGLDNTTFFVYVFGFTTPIVLQISFSQHRTLDLLQFFITFSSCFISLLIIAAVLWKIKQKYDLYRRRQQLFVEMEQMASRPFAAVTLALDDSPVEENNCSKPNKLNDGSRCKKNQPTPVSLELCSNSKAAVISLIVKMPTGNCQYTPTSQCGLAIASALVTLGPGPLCKNTSDLIKGDSVMDSWKTNSHSAACT